jgi:hypothetical protein
MSGPTKTPWAVEVMPSGRITITSGQFFVAGDENGHGIEASDAALIVRAVNAHMQLVAALKKIAEPADGNCGCSYPCRCNSEAYEAIRADAMRDTASEALTKSEAL